MMLDTNQIWILYLAEDEVQRRILHPSHLGWRGGIGTLWNYGLAPLNVHLLFSGAPLASENLDSVNEVLRGGFRGTPWEDTDYRMSRRHRRS